MAPLLLLGRSSEACPNELDITIFVEKQNLTQTNDSKIRIKNQNVKLNSRGGTTCTVCNSETSVAHTCMEGYGWRIQRNLLCKIKGMNDRKNGGLDIP